MEKKKKMDFVTGAEKFDFSHKQAKKKKKRTLKENKFLKNTVCRTTKSFFQFYC